MTPRAKASLLAVMLAGWRAVRWIPGVRRLALGLTYRTALGNSLAAMIVQSPVRRRGRPDALGDHDDSTYGRLRPYPYPDEQTYASLEQRYRAERDASPARIAFVSAMMGDYEVPQRHEHLIAAADYVLVTDSPFEIATAARVVPADYYEIDPARAARFVKTHPHLYAGDTQVIVWIDSNIIIRGDLTEDIERFLASGAPVGIVPHPVRLDVYEEADAVVARRKDRAETVDRQMERYRAAGFAPPPGLLAETGFLMLRMDMPETRRFLSIWWQEIDCGSVRDQLSFTYAAWRAGIVPFPLTARPHSVRDHPRLALIHHETIPAATSGRARRPDPAARLPKPPRDTTVDVVICVHNAPQSTQACLASVAAGRDPARHRILLVDDGSDPTTARLLDDFAAATGHVLLLRNAQALGYTKAANIGLRASSADFVILLNSDTMVAPGFADKLAGVAFATPGAGIVGPLSNAASAQSLPEIGNSARQTATNALPAGMSAADMDAWCAANCSSVFPRVPLIHGFCLGLTRHAISAIGEFDEASFPRGFGEEDDYCLRAATAGVGLVVATNTFVFHEKSQSYGDHRFEIARESARRLVDMHGHDRVRRSVSNVENNPELVRMRLLARRLYARMRGRTIPSTPAT